MKMCKQILKKHSPKNSGKLEFTFTKNQPVEYQFSDRSENPRREKTVLIEQKSKI